MALRLGQPVQVHRVALAADLYPARPSVVAARMVQVLPTAPELTAAQPRAGVEEAAVAQRLGPPAQPAAAVGVAREVPRAPEVSAVQQKVAGAVQAEQAAAAEPQPGAASDAEVLRPEAAAVQDVAVAAPPQGAEAERALVGAERQPVVAPVSEVPRQAARDAQGGLLLAAAWAALPSIRLRGDRPVPSARVAHATRQLRIAQP